MTDSGPSNSDRQPVEAEGEDERSRWETLRDLDEWLEGPLRALGLIWLLLLVWELAGTAPPFVMAASTTIWVIFVADFGLRLALAPNRKRYLRANWLTALSLAVPALRVFRVVRFVRILRVARATRGLRLVRVVGSMNRAMRTLRRLMHRRRLGYVIALTVVVTLLGAAGMYAFEPGLPDGQGFHSFASALWWTAMVMTTMGTDYWPRTPEGRALCLLLALYAFAVFGYITASLASFFIGQDTEGGDAAR